MGSFCGGRMTNPLLQLAECARRSQIGNGARGLEVSLGSLQSSDIAARRATPGLHSPRRSSGSRPTQSLGRRHARGTRKQLALAEYWRRWNGIFEGRHRLHPPVNERPTIDRCAAVRNRRRDDDRRLPFVTICACSQTLRLCPTLGDYRRLLRSIVGRQVQSLRHRHIDADAMLRLRSLEPQDSGP